MTSPIPRVRRALCADRSPPVAEGKPSVRFDDFASCLVSSVAQSTNDERKPRRAGVRFVQRRRGTGTALPHGYCPLSRSRRWLGW